MMDVKWPDGEKVEMKVPIREMYAYTFYLDNEEGICGVPGVDGHMIPMLADNEDDVRRIFGDYAKQCAKYWKAEVTLARFSLRTDIEVIRP